MQTTRAGRTTVDARAALEAIIEYMAEKKILGDLVKTADPQQIDGYLDPIAEKFAAALGLAHTPAGKDQNAP